MFYEETRIKQGPSYVSVCPFRILYNSKFILMATSLGTNAVIVTRVHCIGYSLEVPLFANVPFDVMLGLNGLI